MIKHAFVGFLNGVPDILGERWYLRYHSKEVVRFFGPWLRRYETFKAYVPPEEARPLGSVGGFTTELWYHSVEDFIEAKPMERPYTYEAWMANYSGEAIAPAHALVPAMPTEDFLGKEPTPEQKTIIRWYSLFMYPDGVPPREGDEWYLNVHSQEAKQQKGLLRYISHRVLEDSPLKTPWHRLDEQWYESFEHWKRAVIEEPPKYTPPPWTKEQPFVKSVSNFIRYKPSIDYLKDQPFIP